MFIFSFEARSDQRLDKEKLREERKREIVADKIQPVGKKRYYVEFFIVRIGSDNDES